MKTQTETTEKQETRARQLIVSVETLITGFKEIDYRQKARLIKLLLEDYDNDIKTICE